MIKEAELLENAADILEAFRLTAKELRNEGRG